MGKSIALAAAAVVAAVVAVAFVSVSASASGAGTEQRVMTRAMTRAEAEAIHYARLWTAASEQHVTRDRVTGGAAKWKCCRACAQNTVPILHEAFEGDKSDAPEMKAAPPAEEKKQAFVEIASAGAAAGASSGASASAGHRARAAAGSALTNEQKTEFQEAQTRKQRAQQDALHGIVSDATAYSCCNQCPDLMYPFPGTWNRPSPYSYVPRRFRFAGKNKKHTAGGAVLAEVDATTTAGALQRAKAAAKAAVEAEAEADAEAESESDSEAGSDFEMPTDKAGSGVSKYVWSNPHDLPVYRYWETLRKAAAARDKAMKEGTTDAPIRPGAAPIFHPPPPPHDDIYRIARSPNLHDGFDLQTPPFLPPCCDYCMSTYFPHVINDELQLPKYEPYTMAPVSFAETKATAAGRVGGNHDAISSAEAYAKTLASAKSDSKKCCHKCIRKDIEDTDWQIYALPPKPKSKNPHHKRF